MSADAQRRYRLKHPHKAREADAALRDRGRQFVLAQKKDKPCQMCGGVFHPVAMDYHHRDRCTKSASVSQMLRQPLKRLEDEIAKCDLLCANCHRVLEWDTEA